MLADSLAGSSAKQLQAINNAQRRLERQATLIGGLANRNAGTGGLTQEFHFHGKILTVDPKAAAREIALRQRQMLSLARRP